MLVKKNMRYFYLNTEIKKNVLTQEQEDEYEEVKIDSYELATFFF